MTSAPASEPPELEEELEPDEEPELPFEPDEDPVPEDDPDEDPEEVPDDDPLEVLEDEPEAPELLELLPPPPSPLLPSEQAPKARNEPTAAMTRALRRIPAVVAGSVPLGREQPSPGAPRGAAGIVRPGRRRGTGP